MMRAKGVHEVRKMVFSTFLVITYTTLVYFFMSNSCCRIDKWVNGLLATISGNYVAPRLIMTQHNHLRILEENMGNNFKYE